VRDRGSEVFGIVFSFFFVYSIKYLDTGVRIDIFCWIVTRFFSKI